MRRMIVVGLWLAVASIAGAAQQVPPATGPSGVWLRSEGVRCLVDRAAGLPAQIVTHVGSERSWLHGPAKFEVRNEASGAVAALSAAQVRGGELCAEVEGTLGALKLKVMQRLAPLPRAAGMVWELSFLGDGPRAGHAVTIELPILQESLHVFTPSERGAIAVAAHPTFQPTEYAHLGWEDGRGYILPLVSVMDRKTDSALTLALPADANIPHLQVDWADGQRLRLTLAHRGMGGGQPSQLVLLLLAHAADYRAALKAYSDLFPRYFRPAMARGPHEGCFYYHHIQDHPDFDEMARQRVRFLWSSFWFTHLGEYLPAEKVWHPYTYAKWWRLGQTMSDERINAFLRQMHQHGVGVYAYFNVTEYGGDGGKSGSAEEAARRLREQFANALMKTADGRDIPTWEGAMAMNPGPGYALWPFLQEQVRRHIERLPEFEGFVIDRLDWASQLDYGHRDGLTMLGLRDVENMAEPVAKAVQGVCRLTHQAGKRVLVNQFWRLDVLRDVDGYCHEDDPLPLLGYVSPFRPASAWHHRVGYSGDLLAFEAQLKRRLLWALFPQMIAHKFPISQQGPEPRAADFLELYAPLFAPLSGKEQVLVPHCVEVDGANEANLFLNAAGHYVAPVVSRMRFLTRGHCDPIPATLTLRLPEAGELTWAQVYSADGSPYRAKVEAGDKAARVRIDRHASASVVVIGKGAEPALADKEAGAFAGIRGRLSPARQARPSAPQELADLPGPVAQWSIYLQGEHVGAPDPMAVGVNGRRIGALRGGFGQFPLDGAPGQVRVELAAGNEGTWFVPGPVELWAKLADGRTFRAGQWSYGDAFDSESGPLGRLSLPVRRCRPEEISPARLISADTRTAGAWKPRYGKLAAWLPLVSDHAEQNGFALDVQNGQAFCWSQDATADARVLRAPSGASAKATCWHGNESLQLAIRCGSDKTYRVSLYLLDFDRNKRAMEITAEPLGGAHPVTVDQTAGGVYVTWQVRGDARLKVRKVQGYNATVSGVFVDPADTP